jgi:hypothetical protein
MGRGLAVVDRDPHAPGVDEHELQVLLPARAEPTARRIRHFSGVDINYR